MMHSQVNRRKIGHDFLCPFDCYYCSGILLVKDVEANFYWNGVDVRLHCAHS